MVKKDQLCAIALKLNFESLAQNGCYGNQPQPPEVVFYNIDANTSCSCTKRDDCQISISCKLTLILSAFYRLYLENTLFYTTPRGQIISCHVTSVNCFFSGVQIAFRRRGFNGSLL